MIKELFRLLDEDLSSLIDVLLVIYYDKHLAKLDERNRLNLETYKNAKAIKLNIFENIYNDLMKNLNLNFENKYLNLHESQELSIIKNLVNLEELHWEEVLDTINSSLHYRNYKEFQSNPDVSKFISRLAKVIFDLDIKNKLMNKPLSIIDPACGSCRFLVDMVKAINHKRTKVKGFEINQNTVKLANLILLLAKISDFEIVNTDTIKYYSKEDFVESSDITIIDAPFGAKESTSNPIYDSYDLSYYYDKNRKKSTVDKLDIFVEIGIKITYPGRYIFLQVPNGFLFNAKYQDARKIILKKCILKSVISLPIGSFPALKIKSAILVLQKKDVGLEPKEVFMGVLEDFNETQKFVDKFEKWFESEMT